LREIERKIFFKFTTLLEDYQVNKEGYFERIQRLGVIVEAFENVPTEANESYDRYIFHEN